MWYGETDELPRWSSVMIPSHAVIDTNAAGDIPRGPTGNLTRGTLGRAYPVAAPPPRYDSPGLKPLCRPEPMSRRLRQPGRPRPKPGRSSIQGCTIHAEPAGT